MSKKQMTISIPDWMYEEFIGESKNNSGRIQQLLYYGKKYEDELRKKNAEGGI